MSLFGYAKSCACWTSSATGRLDIGFGKGVSPPEQLLWGVPADEAVARTNEA